MRCTLLFSVLLLAACAEPAEDEPTTATSGEALTNDVLRQALAAGEIGEMATGYLGIVNPERASDELRRSVADNTIKRRALYTKVSESLVWTTVQDVAKRTACNVFAQNILPGHTYRKEDGTWTRRTDDASVVMPSFCVR